MSFAAWVRERASPRSPRAASSRESATAGSVASVEPGLQLLVDLRERDRARLERLILDQSQARKQGVRVPAALGVRVLGIGHVLKNIVRRERRERRWRLPRPTP